MSATLYQNELTSLASESKRKYPEIRTAAEKALQDLKAINITSEQQLAADLQRRPDFIDAFLKSCQTSNTKLAISGVNALQRLVISQGLPISRLEEALQAFNSCTELGLDIQLKVLQALPSLVQNYSDELHGDLLGSALQVCAALQSAKVSTISAVAAATLQQLVTSVFTRVAEEDARAGEIATSATVHGEDSTIEIRPAAYDAFRVLRDLVLAAEGRPMQFVQSTTLSREASLELIASCVEAKPQLISTHEELSKIVRNGVIPLATTCLTENLSFQVTLRCVRLLRLLVLRYFAIFESELEPAISLFAHTLEADAAWKRILIMELLRDMFIENSLVVKAFMAYDQSQGGKPVVQDILAAFVRLSAEKPTLTGLGQQSTIPVQPSSNRETHAEQLVSDPVGSMTGMLSSFGVMESHVQGLSSQWSTPKTPCYEQLDKSQPPTLPETYIYTLVLDCLNAFSDTLAKIVLPITMQQRDRSGTEHTDEESSSTTPIRAAARLVESCWPAVLATCSTFMNAALDDGYYRALIKAYQRFAQVAGLLRLDTPRDALMTTLGKAAVPPQVLNAVTSDLSRSPAVESHRVFSNPKNLLSIESLVSQASSLSQEKDRRASFEQTKPTLTVRNLLCLRALLNLAIALGPTLDGAFNVVVQVLKQADMVLSNVGPQQIARASTQSDAPSIVQSFSAEVSAVEAAASRLLESTADYPDKAFNIVLRAFGELLHTSPAIASPTIPEEPTSPASPQSRQRTLSSAQVTKLHSRDYQFILPKLGHLAALNVARFVASDVESSGWRYLTETTIAVAASNSSPANARRSATDLLCRLAAESIHEVAQQDTDIRSLVQDRSLQLLLRIVAAIYDEDGELTTSDLEVQSRIIESTKVILEQSGDSIVAGWDKLIGILSSTFESDEGIALLTDGPKVDIDWSHLSNDLVSLRLGREAFGAIQLLVTDFFSLLPVNSSAAVIELLFRFMSQSEDLNLSLTAITVSWNVADLLFSTREDMIVLPRIAVEEESAHFEAQLTTASKASRSAQWVLLLLKLRLIVRQGQREPAKAAFQTLCSIGKSVDEDLPTQVWAILLRHILIGTLADDAVSPDWEERALTPLILDGVAETIAQQIDLVNRLPKLDDTWKDLLQILDTLLGRTHADTLAAVYRALAAILQQVKILVSAWDQPTLRTAQLWFDRPPFLLTHEATSNQPAFKAYAELASQLLRLRKEVLDSEFAQRLLTHLARCVEISDSTVYSADFQVLTPLQSQVCSILRSIPHEIEGVIARQTVIAAEFARLHQSSKKHATGSSKPSFVALCAASISWLEELILKDAASDSLLTAIKCLADLIEEKYHFHIQHKDSWLWRRATRTASIVAKSALAQADVQGKDLKAEIWRQYARIVRNIVHANGLTQSDNARYVYEDELSDIEAFRDLSKIMIPGLGSDWMTSEDLKSYMWALFEASFVHPIEATELLTAEDDPLGKITSVRRGRVKKISPSNREEMSYECFAQLVKLSSSIDASSEEQRLAQAAAPLLVFRLAIPIRTFIADQPLRGRMPQPLSELEELLYSFEQIGQLRLSSKTLGVLDAYGEQAHMRFLYPLLAKAVRVAGDKRCGTKEVFDPLQELLERLTNTFSRM